MTGTEPARLPVTPEQLAFLDEPRFAVVATVGADGLPHQTVMWYECDGDSLVLSTPSGSRKHRDLLRDRRMSVCVEDGFRYLTLSGTVTVDASDPVAARERYARIGQRYAGALGGGGRPAPLDPKAAELLSRDRVTLRLAVDHVHSNGFG